MKNKTKSLKTRIFALVMVVCLFGLSCLPCLALTEQGATASSIGSIPIYLHSTYDVFYGDMFESNFQERYYFGSLISFGDDGYTSSGFEPYASYSYYTTGTDDTMITYYMDSNQFISINELYTVYGFHTTYNISCGNFLIDTAEDAFSFDIRFSADQYYASACAYTVLNGTSDMLGDVQYYAYEGIAGGGNIYFDLGEHLADLVGGDSLVLVSALSIEWESRETTVYESQSIQWTQNETIIERNLNGAWIDWEGTPSVSMLNYTDTISQAFENLGIEKYKDSFVNYTADYTTWLGNAVGGFLNMELFPFFSIGGILLICVAIGLVGYFLKVFMGG